MSFFEKRSLLHDFQLGNLRIKQGCDHHIDLCHVDRFISTLLGELEGDRSDLIILNGDHFDTSGGEPAQAAMGEVLRGVGKATCARVLYVPGNHCLRGDGHKVWGNFGALPANVIAPLDNPLEPIRIPYCGGEVLIGNIFCDLTLINEKIPGYDETTLRDFYRNELNDGRHLFEGDMSMFGTMADNLARALTPDVTLLVTHFTPTRELTKLRIARRDAKTERLEKGLGVPFVEDPAGSNHYLFRNKAERQRRFWNRKAFLMGSDVLTRPGANMRNGLMVISGHNHTREDGVRRTLRNGRTAFFFSYQGVHWSSAERRSLRCELSAA